MARAQLASPGFDFDAVHRGTWKLPARRRPGKRRDGWIDAGEEAAFQHVAPQVRDRPILDIGVGDGRTTEPLRAISRDYIGIDYSRAVVQACRARHPHVQISHMDARDLRRFDDSQFALVVFTGSGIDAAQPADRLNILREVHRVLRPMGLFILTAHNRDWRGHEQEAQLPGALAWIPLWLGRRTMQRVLSLPIQVGAEGFGAPAGCTTLAGQKSQLAGAGLRTERVLDNLSGRPLESDADTRGCRWLHYIARKI